MKKAIVIDILILVLGIPAGLLAAYLAGVREPVFEMIRVALNPISTGILSSSIIQTLVLLGPLFLFFCATILTLASRKQILNYLLASMTSILLAFLVVSTLFVRYGP
jgi:hypothetical protein